MTVWAENPVTSGYRDQTRFRMKIGALTKW